MRDPKAAAEMTTLVGAPGKGVGTTVAGGDVGSDVPHWFRETTETEYEVPLERPVIVHPITPAAVHEAPPGVDVATKLVAVPPPDEGVQLTSVEPS